MSKMTVFSQVNFNSHYLPISQISLISAFQQTLFLIFKISEKMRTETEFTIFWIQELSIKILLLGQNQVLTMKIHPI